MSGVTVFRTQLQIQYISMGLRISNADKMVGKMIHTNEGDNLLCTYSNDSYQSFYFWVFEPDDGSEYPKYEIRLDKERSEVGGYNLWIRKFIDKGNFQLPLDFVVPMNEVKDMDAVLGRIKSGIEGF